MNSKLTQATLERVYSAETILKAIAALTEDDTCLVGPAVLNQLARVGMDCTGDAIGVLTDNG